MEKRVKIYVRILTIDVNGEESCLTFKEAINGEEEKENAVEMVEEEEKKEKKEKKKEVEENAVEIVEEENPDCVIIVYAIDDRDSFGEYSDINLFPFLI